MDLFGDLPAAKNTPAPTTIISGSSNSASQAIPIETVESRKPTSSLVTALGAAGTTMAFVPQALRKRKRPMSTPQQSIEIQKNYKVSNKSNGGTKNEAERVENDDGTLDQPHIPMVVEEPSDNLPQDASDDTDEPYLENEPESLRLLHEQAKISSTPYDPHFPNDYLAHRERKKTAAAMRDMQSAALAKLESQEKLRKKIEEERRRIERSGNVDAIAESRGRGRGKVSNLPAWLVEKQREKEAEGCVGQFEDAVGENDG